MDSFLSRWDGLLWLLGLLIPSLLVQRRVHFEIQAVLLLLTRRKEIAHAVFALLFFPGVLLHELSHFLMARFLRVRTGRISLIPRSLPDGRLQLGFVETEPSDPLRDALIGLAPLLAGGAAVALIGVYRLGLPELIAAFDAWNWPTILKTLANLPALPDFWLWFYLAFAISSTMLPSTSDQRAWLPVVLGIALVIILALLAGAGPWLLEHAAPWLNRAFGAAAAVFGITLALHVLLWLPAALLRMLLSKITGLKVE